MLAVFGQIIHWPTVITLALFPVIILIYVRLARREEAALLECFGEAYRSYRQARPMFFPRGQEWRCFLHGLFAAHQE
ncbi:hypothetical protein D9M69_430220 [compost metagenome]